jgi:hypothetical protein
LFFGLEPPASGGVRWTLMRAREGGEPEPLGLAGTERLDDQYFDRDPHHPPITMRLRCGRQGCIRARSDPDAVVFERYDPVSGLASELARAPLTTSENAWTAAHAPDGRFALLTHEPRGRPTLRLLAGGADREVPLPDGCLMHSLDFAPDGALLAVCASPGPDGVAYPLWRFDPASGEAAELWRAARPQPASSPRVSPDGTRVAFTVREVDGDLWLLEAP